MRKLIRYDILIILFCFIIASVAIIGVWQNYVDKIEQLEQQIRIQTDKGHLT